MDTEDRDKKLAMPLLLLYGEHGHPPERAREFLDIWTHADDIGGFEAMPCSHYMQEEMPDEIYAHYTKFFA
jgi:hypothetical protein